MIIRATAKLLKLSGIKAVKNEKELAPVLPGEWYANLLSMNRSGKLATHFLHYPTKISIIIPGKSLNKTLPILPERVADLLKRQGFSALIPKFQLQEPPVVFATNSRSMLAHMNQLRYNLEYHLAMPETIEAINYAEIEDGHLDWLFTRNGKAGDYEKPLEILDGLK